MRIRLKTKKGVRHLCRDTVAVLPPTHTLTTLSCFLLPFLSLLFASRVNFETKTQPKWVECTHLGMFFAFLFVNETCRSLRSILTRCFWSFIARVSPSRRCLIAEVFLRYVNIFILIIPELIVDFLYFSGLNWLPTMLSSKFASWPRRVCVLRRSVSCCVIGTVSPRSVG